MTTRHGSRDGTFEDFGCIYFELDDSNHLRRDLTPDEIKAALDAHMERVGEAAGEPTPEAGWSEWLDWAGGECPLPATATVQVVYRDGIVGNVGAAGDRIWRADSTSNAIVRFRYREDAPGGWVERGDFIPPASLWDEASPVRCEWTHGMGVAHSPGRSRPGTAYDWEDVTHIRLLPRAPASEPAPEMPDAFHIGSDGALYARSGLIFDKKEYDRYGPDTIRAAVEAWLDQMGKKR